MSGVWLRSRSTVVYGFILLAAGLAFVFSRSEWSSDLDWALNWALGSTILIAPATAGLAAWSVVQNYSLNLQGLLNSVPKGARAPIDIGIAVAWCGVVAWLVCVVVASVTVLSSGGTLTVTRNVVSLMNGPIVVVASALVGSSIAVAYRSVASAPIAAGTVYLVALTSFRTPPIRVLWEGGATGVIDGLVPRPDVVAVTGLVNLAVAFALATLVVVTGHRSQSSRRWWVAIGTAAILLTAMFLVPRSGSYFAIAQGHP